MRIPELYLQIYSNIRNKGIRRIITDREIIEAINRVIYRTSAVRLRRIIDEMEIEFKLIDCISKDTKPKRYKIIENIDLKKQLIRLEYKTFPF